MHKIVIHRPGDTNRLSLEESPSLTPKKNELIVAVRASGVNFADVIIRKGLYSSANKSVVAFNLSYLFNRKDLLRQAMGDLIGWIEEGKVKSPPVKTVAMADVGQAHRLIESGNTVGKLVLIP